MVGWRCVTMQGFQHYLICNVGGLILNTRTGKIIKGWVNESGYRRVLLTNGSKSTQQYIHRLVAMAWCENTNPEFLIEVNHIDRTRINCDAINLEWTTKEYNLKYRYVHYTKSFIQIEL